MKVEIQFLIEGELGRKAWVTRTNNQLAFGTIYAQEKDATVLSQDEINYLLDNQGFKYLVNKIIFIKESKNAQD